MTGFFAILKHAAMLADDTSLAVKNTASILSDDIAVTAEKSTSFSASRELPAIWAIVKGSFVNKLIILPVMLLLSAFSPTLIKYILVLGGVYLSYEGYEKIDEYFFSYNEEDIKSTLSDNEVLKNEKTNVKNAIVTDFVLSVEIVLVALSTVMDKSLIEQIIVTTIASFAATIGVYGLVALIVRLDDIGIWFAKKGYKTIGLFLIKLMRFSIVALGYIGTIAMFLVAGAIFAHNVPFIHELIKDNLYFPGVLYLLTILAEIVISFIVGLALFASFDLVVNYWKKYKAKNV